MSLIYNIKFKIIKLVYPKKIRKTSAKSDGRIYVGGPSFVTNNTYLGNNVCFNGMKIFGNGKVIIGDNFHSGSVVCKNIPKYSIAGGHPAIPFKTINVELYEKIKKMVNFINIFMGETIC